MFIVLWVQGGNTHLPPESEFLAAVPSQFFLSVSAVHWNRKEIAEKKQESRQACSE